MSDAEDVADLGLGATDHEASSLNNPDAEPAPAEPITKEHGSPTLNQDADSDITLLPPSTPTPSHRRAIVSREGNGLSSADGPLPTPDDTASIKGSFRFTTPPRPNAGSPTQSFRPFDRRFTSRLSPSPLARGRVGSSGSAVHLRSASWQSSLGSHAPSESTQQEEAEKPWEVIKWTKLRKITGEAFSEAGRRGHGKPTCFAVSTIIAIGTSRGLILVFDRHQNLKAILGAGTKAAESGALKSIALSSDDLVVAAGYANGNVLTFEIAKPAKPMLQILANSADQIAQSRKDSHVAGSAILHVGFLGPRHTALVSADENGMAFSHLSTRGMSAVMRIVNSQRLLGRYPSAVTGSQAARKPSSVLHMSVLRLSANERPTDNMGLIALITPYLVVVVSTMPVANTQFKSSRPAEVASHSAVCATVSWSNSSSKQSNIKFAYSWANVLSLVSVEPDTTNAAPEQPTELTFNQFNLWTAEEAIVATEWLNDSVIACLTISQHLIILDAKTCNVLETSDLLGRHIYHDDLFTRQLGPAVEKVGDVDNEIHGVVADAFFQSFRVHRGHIFTLGFTEIAFGSISNWADRLLAIMEEGDFLAAIHLVASYYFGEASLAVVGLPESLTERRRLVETKLYEIITASLRHAFRIVPETGSRRSPDEELEALAQVCFRVCLKAENASFLYEDVYNAYQENEMVDMFFQLLESSVDAGEISTVSPVVLRDFINHLVAKNRASDLERLICKLRPDTMDFESLTELCRAYHLYDALLYIWSQALRDYTTVLKDLLKQAASDEDDRPGIVTSLFPYLAFCLTGRVYPTGEAQADDQAERVKTEIYDLLFSGSVSRDDLTEPRYLYLKTILKLDTSAFMSVLNEAFEDTFLDPSEGTETPSSDGPRSPNASRRKMNRTYVISVLMSVLTPGDYEKEDTLFFDMFIARNLPKFPQFLRLPGHVLHRVLLNLCEYPDPDQAEDCQLSVEYLLSIYRPPDMMDLIPRFKQAGFYRVVKSAYKNEGLPESYFEACLEYSDNLDDTFLCIGEYLGPTSKLNSKQREEFRDVLVKNAANVLDISIEQTASTIQQYAPDLHQKFLDQTSSDDYSTFRYLQELFEPPSERKTHRENSPSTPQSLLERYVQLLCEFDRDHVGAFLTNIQLVDLKLENVWATLEGSGIVNEAITLLGRAGEIEKGLQRLLDYLRTSESAVLGLIEARESSDLGGNLQAAKQMVENLDRYFNVGTWLCRLQPPQTNGEQSRQVSRNTVKEPLNPREMLWVEYVFAVSEFTQHVNESLSQYLDPNPKSSNASESTAMAQNLHDHLLSITQKAFSALLDSTTSNPQPLKSVRKPLAEAGRSKPTPQSDLSFLRILRAYLSKTSNSVSSSSLSHLRSTLSSVFASYTYEEGLLRVVNTMLEQDLFLDVSVLSERRKRGWRPLGMACQRCEKRCWGPGVGQDVWDAWRLAKAENAEHVEKMSMTVRDLSVRKDDYMPFLNGDGKDVKGKSRDETQSETQEKEQEDARLVIFACRHMFHKRCLDELQLEKAKNEERLPRKKKAQDLPLKTRSDGVPLYQCPLGCEAF